MLYRIDGQKAQPMPEVAAVNEAADLHDLLRHNLDLLPGDQISPDEPRRWLLVANEAPVADPETTSDRWSLDLLLGDQDAVPTLVEVKRAGDPRAKREVVAQMLDYAANGHYYWEAPDLLHASRTLHDGLNTSLDEAVRELGKYESAERYFEAYVENLREGQVRLVFFLERAARGLTSIVEFLNRQMERTEVLVVEARLYESDGQRFVQPRLFGYTEEARRAKRRVTVERQSVWTRESVVAFAQERPDDAAATIVVRLERTMAEAGFTVGQSRSKVPTINWFTVSPRRLLFSANTDGGFWLYSGWADKLSTAEFFRGGLRECVHQVLGLDRPDILEKPYLLLSQQELDGREEDFAQALRVLVDEAVAGSCGQSAEGAVG